ncbi:MAG: metal ABC transporter permease [Spirochaetes bacterium]|nr:metal ABC transporter permease [Spirochaetota bacterium]
MAELFTMDFFRNAFLASILLGVLFGVLSFIVVARKMSFLGAGIAHTAFGGVALGIFLNTNPFLSALVFCALSAIVIAKLTRLGKMSHDVGIGIFFAFSMALGVILIKLKKAYTFDVQGYLFGNILAVTSLDLFLALGVLALFLPFVVFFIHRILFVTIDEEVATVSGVHTQFIDTALSAFLAAIIVISMKIVGIILVSALVVLPASFGILLTKNFRVVIASGIFFSVCTMCGGLMLSYYFDTPAGATMVVLGTAAYGLGTIISAARK